MFQILSGPNIPRCTFYIKGYRCGFYDHAMVSLGKRIVLIAGRTKYRNLVNEMYQFQCFDLNCYWLKLDQMLQHPRASFVAMAIPHHLTDCHENNVTHSSLN